MKSKQIFSSLFVFAFVIWHLSFGIPQAYADTCTTQYGQYGNSTNCQPSDLIINKQVKNPITNNFVENLSANDPTFSPGSDVWYRLTIQNTSGQTFDPVTVKDVLPTYETFVAGPGTYDANTRTLTFTLNNLIAGETRTVDIEAQVVATNQFPMGKTFVCVNNYAQVSALNRFDSDTAQSCIQTNVLGATTLPVAGFNDYLLLLPFAGVGLSGFALLRKRG